MRIIAERDVNCEVLNKKFDGFRGQKIEVFMRDNECIVLIDGEEFKVCEGLPLEIVVSSDPMSYNNAEQIQRHEFYQFGVDAFMIEATDGEYVKYDDHIALLNKYCEDTQA